MNNSKLPWKTKIGYGLCTIVDAVPYELFYIYFVFFLTDIVGVRPALAGFISFVALLWDTVTDPPIGKLSDGYATKKGRRLPWLKASILPLAITIFLMFAPFPIKGGFAQGVFYIAVTMLVWTFYDTFMIPYVALGAEITSDYNERNVLRFLAMIIYYPFLALVTSGPMWIWDFAKKAGYSDRAAWAGTGFVYAVVMLVICCIGLRLIRNCEKPTLKNALEAKINRVKENAFKTWANCLRIKSFRRVIIWILVYMLGFSMFNTVAVYFMTYNVGMNESQQAIFWIFYVAVVVCALPVTTFFCNKFGKKPAMLVAMTPVVIAGYVLFFVGIKTVAVMYLYAALSVVASSAFFTFYMGYAYDCVEVDEFLTGERREGSMTALSSFAQKLGSALTIYGTGLLLDVFGYDGTADIQSAGALKGISALATLFPAILFTVALIILTAYPITKKKYNLLCAALEKKRAVEPYSTEGFEDLL